MWKKINPFDNKDFLGLLGQTLLQEPVEKFTTVARQGGKRLALEEIKKAQETIDIQFREMFTGVCVVADPLLTGNRYEMHVSPELYERLKKHIK
jgi:hypothetical protein